MFDFILKWLRPFSSRKRIAKYINGLGDKARVGDKDALQEIIDWAINIFAWDSFGRTYALAELRRLKEPYALDVLVYCLQSSDPFVSEEAAHGISELGELAIVYEDIILKVARKYPNRGLARYLNPLLIKWGHEIDDKWHPKGKNING